MSELSSNKHKALKVSDYAGIEYANTQHLMNIRVTEVAKVACEQSVFFARNSHNGHYTLSALASFSVKQNLFVNNLQWQALYTPVCMQVYPLQLLTRAANSRDYFIAIDDTSKALNESDGQALFDDNGNPSLYLSAQKKLLESDLNNDYLSYQFIEKMTQLGLIKGIDIVLEFEGIAAQTIQGLSTIDEDKLKTLDDNTIIELHKLGYMSVINAMLLSLFQLNALVKLHNKQPHLNTLKQVKLMVSNNLNTL